MATFLDVTGLAQFTNIFVFLFALIGIWALLAYYKVLGDNKLFQALIALAVSFFVLFSDTAVRLIASIAPWFAVLFLFIILITMASKMVSASDVFESSGLKSLVILVIIVSIVVGAAAEMRKDVTVPGDNETDPEYDRDYSQVSTVIFHPKILGMILIFAVAVFTVGLLISNKM
jgi:hypothetical protein